MGYELNLIVALTSTDMEFYTYELDSVSTIQKTAT